jgi:hypothetical protein
LCLHLSFVPGTLVLNPSIVPNPDTSTVRAHCVRSVPTAVECFLRHRYMFFLPNYIFIERPRHIFWSMMTYIFIERPPIPTGPGSSSWAGASPAQQPMFEPPTSEDYNTGDIPPLEFQLDDLFRDTANEIDGTQLAGAPLVGTQQTQEQQHTITEDFHDSAQRAGEVLAAAASVEAEVEAWSTGEQPVPCGSATPKAATRGGPSRRARLLHRQRPEGGVPSSSVAPLATLPPAGGRRMRSPSTRPPHVPQPPHEGRREGGSSDEEEGAPVPATTDETRSYLDLFLDTRCVHYFCLF